MNFKDDFWWTTQIATDKQVAGKRSFQASESRTKDRQELTGISIEQVAQNPRKYLYPLWNRMSSGSYFPKACTPSTDT